MYNRTPHRLCVSLCVSLSLSLSLSRLLSSSLDTGGRGEGRGSALRNPTSPPLEIHSPAGEVGWGASLTTDLNAYATVKGVWKRTD